MEDVLTIDEVVRRTGLTSRALRFYEARGLISPLRTAAGRRLFGAGELERVHRIIALKRAGLSLGHIKRLFDRKPVDLAALLGAQRERLTEQAREIAEATALIDTALSRIGRGEPLDAATLCSLIRDGDKVMSNDETAWKGVYERYHSSEQQAEWAAAMNRLDESDQFDHTQYQQQWSDLGSRIAAALPLDPASGAALGFVREWFALLEPFSRVATPAMWQGNVAMFEDMNSWEGQADPGFSADVWSFIHAATTCALSAGYDIGPLPVWFGQSPKGDKA
jgi:MerR family transcriptional regulator, thiopeptide resistance regulator